MLFNEDFQIQRCHAPDLSVQHFRPYFLSPVYRGSFTLEYTAVCVVIRALCRIKLLPVTHVLVDTWVLTVKLVYELSSVPDDLKWATNTHMTPFTLTFKA